MAEINKNLRELPSHQELELEKLVKDAVRQLALVGLSPEDLLNKGRIIDLGAQDCAIERLARSLGINSVTSVDKKFPARVLDKELNLIVSDARDLKLPNEGADLIISRAGPHFKIEKEDDALKVLQEMNRVLTKDGEMRLHPIRFGFIQEFLKEKYEKYSDILSAAPFTRSGRDLEELTRYNNEANELTLEFLKRNGFKFSIEDILANNLTANVSGDQRVFSIVKKKF